VHRGLTCTIVAVGLGAALAIGVARAGPEAEPRARILVFTKTAGFRHASIPVAVRAVRELVRQSGLVVDATENAAAFSRANLRRYTAVVFLSTTGDVLDARQQAAFEGFIRSGGGYVGVHAAADTEYGWGWYGGLLGTRFRNHPHIQHAAITVTNRRHPSTAHLPGTWHRVDEWYNFARSPRRTVRVLATLDERTYSPGEGAMGADHPIVWAQEYQGGRAWYTGGGHTDESYAEPRFRRHLLGGIRYAAGLTPPRILSVTPTVRNRRLVVSLRYRSCSPCKGRLDVGASGTPIGLSGGRGRARSARLPRGRRQFSVVLTDPISGVTDTVRRSVRVE
jgi:cytochrome c